MPTSHSTPPEKSVANSPEYRENDGGKIASFYSFTNLTEKLPFP
jgi:hypothetical protein